MIVLLGWRCSESKASRCYVRRWKRTYIQGKWIPQGHQKYKLFGWKGRVSVWSLILECVTKLSNINQILKRHDVYVKSARWIILIQWKITLGDWRELLENEQLPFISNLYKMLWTIKFKFDNLRPRDLSTHLRSFDLFFPHSLTYEN